MSTSPVLEEVLDDQEIADDQPSLAHITNNKLDLSGCFMDGLHPTCFTSTYIQVYNVSSLDLSNNQLKEVPASLGELCNLEVLDLQSNQLSKLPSTIGLLTRLTNLHVSGNMLTSLPQSIAECKALKELNVGFNQLEHLPLRLGQELGSLEILSLHSNKLTFLPPSICHLRHLKVLDLHFNKLEFLPSAIGNLSSLQMLNISNNFSDFGGNLPQSLGDISGLMELDLSYNQVRVLPDSLGALSNLRILKVDNNPLVVPPIEVVEHSMEAMLQYLAERWNALRDLKDKKKVHALLSSKHLNHSASSSIQRSGSRMTRFLAEGCTHRPRMPMLSNVKILHWPTHDHGMHERLG